MNSWFLRWFRQRWRVPEAAERVELLRSYHATFANEHGIRVLMDLFDTVYCTVCDSNNPQDLAEHNGRRRVVHQILQALDVAENPAKYQLRVESEAEIG